MNPIFAGRKTPFYTYDSKVLGNTLDAVALELGQRPLWKVHYAVKACFNPAVLSFIASRGFGADCVSGWEISAAIRAGFLPGDIVFAGVGKSDCEIELGLTEGIGRYNVESVEELRVISEIAARLGKVASVALRVNPDIGAHTHANITTGLSENKFGIHKLLLPYAVRLALELPGVELRGLHFHIGSQITDMGDFVALGNRINEIVAQLGRQGLPSGDINVGGGLGVDYANPSAMPDFAGYFGLWKRLLPPSVPVHFELGRSLVAQCGSLVSRVLYVKEGLTKHFAVLDAGMTDLIRPALYHAVHKVENLTSALEPVKYDVVGPVCESSDVFARGVMLPECRRGDLVALRSAGAYGESMASGYNCRPLPQGYLD